MGTRILAGRTARAIAAGIAFAGIAAAAAAPAAPAGATTRRLVTGSVSGSAPFQFNAGCSFVHQHYIGTITNSQGNANTFDVDVCVDFGGTGGFTASGTFTIADGSTATIVSGTASGQLTGQTPTSPFGFALHVDTVAPGALAHVGEILRLRGVWKSDMSTGGPINGKLIDHA